MPKKRSKKRKSKAQVSSRKPLLSRVASMVKRNRSERRHAEVYRLTPLLDRNDPDILELSAPEHHIEGTFGQYVVVSVPESCNMARAEEIKEQVMALVHRPVVVMSHNITLLKATKLGASEAAECIRKGEEYAAAAESRLADLASGSVQSCGSRSGSEVSGDGGLVDASTVLEKFRCQSLDGPALFGEDLSQEATLDWAEQDIAAPRIGGAATHGGAEACGVGLGAAQADDSYLRHPGVEEAVPSIPVEDGIESAEGFRLAGPYAEQHRG